MSEVFSNAGNPNLDNSSEPVSLLDLKIERLQNNVALKREKLQPSRNVQDIFNDYDNIEDSGNSLFSLAKSSLYRSKENVGNFLTGETNPNRQAEADLKAGFTGRETLNNKQDSIIQSLAQSRVNFSDGNTLKGLSSLGSAVYNTAKIAPELAADSAGSLVEGAVGVGLTLLPEAASSVTGVGLLGKKAKQTKDTVTGIGEAINKAEATIKSGKKASVLEKALVKSVKAASQTSVMTASVLQEMKEDYLQENGQTPGAEYYAVNAPIAVALNTVQLGIFKKIFLPSKAGVKADVAGIKKYAKEMKDVLDPIPKNYSKQVALKVLSTAKDVAIAGGAEAGQEYLQTWHEILATKMDNLSLNEAVKELSEGSNQDKALFGLLAGGAAGGVTKGTLKAPSLALGTTTAAASSVVKNTANKVKNSALQNSYKLLSEKEKAEVEKDFERNSTIHNEFVKTKNSQIDELKNSSSFKNLKDSELISEVNKISDELKADKNDASVFSEITKIIENKYKAAINSSAKNLASSNSGRVLKGNLNTAKDGAINLKERIKTASTELDYSKAVAFAETINNKAVKIVNKIQSKEALDVIEKGINFTKQSGRAKAKELKEIAESTSLKDLKRAVKVLKNKNQYVSNLLEKVVKRKEKVETTFTQKQTSINKNSLSPAMKSVLKAGNITKQAFTVATKEIAKVANSRIEDIKSAEQIQKIIKIYENSEFNKSDDKLKLTKKELSDLKNKVEKRLKFLKEKAKNFNDSEEVAEVKENLKETFEKRKDEVVQRARQLKGKNANDKISKAEKDFISSDTESEKAEIRTNFLYELGLGNSNKENLSVNLIKNGIDTKEKFEDYLKEIAPTISNITFNKTSLVKMISDKIYDVELKKYQETAKNESKKEKSSSKKEKIKNKEELKTILKDYEIEADHYVNDDDIATKELDESTIERITKIAEDLGNKNMICGIK